MGLEPNQQIEIALSSTRTRSALASKPYSLPFCNSRRDFYVDCSLTPDAAKSMTLRADACRAAIVSGFAYAAGAAALRTHVLHTDRQLFRCAMYGLFEREVKSILDVFPILRN